MNRGWEEEGNIPCCAPGGSGRGKGGRLAAPGGRNGGAAENRNGGALVMNGGGGAVGDAIVDKAGFAFFVGRFEKSRVWVIFFV